MRSFYSKFVNEINIRLICYVRKFTVELNHNISFENCSTLKIIYSMVPNKLYFLENCKCFRKTLPPWKKKHFSPFYLHHFDVWWFHLINDNSFPSLIKEFYIWVSHMKICFLHRHSISTEHCESICFSFNTLFLSRNAFLFLTPWSQVSFLKVCCQSCKIFYFRCVIYSQELLFSMCFFIRTSEFSMTLNFLTLRSC